MAKYVDDVGLARFWGNIKGKIGNRAVGAISVDSPHYVGWFKPSDISAQSVGAGCPITSTIWAQGFASDTGSGEIQLIDYSSDTMVVAYEGNIGHCNGMAYDAVNDTLYVVVGRYGSASSPTYTQDILIFSVSTSPMGLTYQQTISPTWTYNNESIQLTGIGYDQVYDKLYVCTRSCQYFAELERSTYQIVNTVQVSDYVVSGNTQTIAAYNGYIYMILGNENIIAIYEADTGLYCGTAELPLCNDIKLAIGEVEGGGFIDGDMIITAVALSSSTVKYGQVLSLTVDGGRAAYLNYANAVYFNHSSTAYSGDGSSSSKPLPYPGMLNNMFWDSIATVYITGAYTDVPALGLRGGINISTINFNGATGIASFELLGASNMYITNLSFAGQPSSRNASLYLGACGLIWLYGVSFAGATLKTYDIQLNNSAGIIMESITPRSGDTIRVHRNHTAIIATTTAISSNVTITGTTAAPAML